MKHIKFFTMSALFAASVLFTSCSKENEPIVNVNSSASLDAGKSGIMFNTNANFVTTSEFNLRNTVSTSATSTTNGGSRLISLTAVEYNTVGLVRSASVTISLPSAATTTAGNLTADLSTPAGSTIIADVNLTSHSGTTSGYSYDSQAGTLTITKLTATEIEGSFSGTVTDASTSTSYVVTNGSFAGKFN